MLGIPTCSDVQDPEYQKALTAEKLCENIERDWEVIFSYIDPESEKRNSSELLKQKIRKIEELEGNLNKSENLGITITKAVVKTNVHPNTLSYIEGPTFTLRRDIRTRQANPTLIQIHSPNEGEYKYKVQFNPLELARFELREYRSALQNAISQLNDESDLEFIKQLNYNKKLAIAEVTKIFKESAHVELIEHSLVDSRSFKFQNHPFSKVGKLGRQHLQIAEESDAYIDFDEDWFVIKNPNEIKRIWASGLLGQSLPKTFDQLYNRQLMRKELMQFLEKQGKVRINGVEYKYDNGLFAGRKVPQAIVNIFGIPVRSNYGTVEPSPWAKREQQLVTRCINGDATAEEEFLRVYTPRNKVGTPDENKKDLTYILKKVA